MEEGTLPTCAPSFTSFASIRSLPAGAGDSRASKGRLSIAADHPRRWFTTADSSCGEFAHFNLSAHLLDLRGLLFQACCESFNFLPLLRGSRLEILLLLRDRRFLFCDSGLQLLHCPMFFEELVQQHRVHGLVAH